MVFNVHVAPIGEKSVSKPAIYQIRKGTMETAKHPLLVNVPTDKSINKYPVRIFDLQPQR